MLLPTTPNVRIMTREFLDPGSVLKDLKTRRAQGSLATLSGDALRRGYKPVDSEREVLGYRQRFEATQPISPPRGVPGGAVQDVEVEIRVQSLSKGGRSRDQAALVTSTIRAGNTTETYDAFLEAPGGNFSNPREWIVDNGKVVEANSWWSAFWKCLHRKCVSTCLTALVTCSGTWAAYIGCVLVRCGGCGVRCAGCATCDCRWWCKWAAGCCSQ